MSLEQKQHAVGVFSTHQDAENALRELQNSGFPMEQISIIAQNANPYDELDSVEVITGTGNQSVEGAKAGATAGGVIGSLVGLIAGLTTLVIPGIGPVTVGGALTALLAETLAGGAIGAATGGFAGSLMGLGVPEEQASLYDARVGRGNYIVIVEGTNSEVTYAEEILSHWGVQDWGIYNLPNASAKYTYTD